MCPFSLDQSFSSSFFLNLNGIMTFCYLLSLSVTLEVGIYNITLGASFSFRIATCCSRCYNCGHLPQKLKREKTILQHELLFYEI